MSEKYTIRTFVSLSEPTQIPGLDAALDRDARSSEAGDAASGSWSGSVESLERAVEGQEAGKPEKIKKAGRGVLDLPKAIEERMSEGRAERERGSARGALPSGRPPAGRPDPVGDRSSSRTRRACPSSCPIRYGRMIVSPFTFYRGGAAIMAWDLAHTPTTALRVQCCGDAHLSNFGVFAAPDRRLVFDLNDFDETLPGAVRVGHQAPGGELRGRRRATTVTDPRSSAQLHARGGRAYRTAMAEVARCASSTSGTRGIDVDELLARAARRPPTKRAARPHEKSLAQGAQAHEPRLARRFAEQVDGGYRIKQEPPVIVRPAGDRARTTPRSSSAGPARLRRDAEPDRRIVLDHYHFVDFARKVVGVGSVGTEAYMVLLMGDRDDDPLFLQVKEAPESVLAPYAGASEYEHQGERVVQGQRSCRPRATRSSAGSPAPASCTATSTSASCAT